MKQNPGETNLTLEELQAMLTSGSYPVMMSKLMHVAKGTTGTSANWHKTKEHLKDTIKQVGALTIFGPCLVQIFIAQNSTCCSIIIRVRTSEQM